MGVEVITSSPVLQCDERGVDLADRRIEAGSVVWAAGVMASPAGQWLSAEHDRAGRVVVRPDLSLQGFNDVFVIGDTASGRTSADDQFPVSHRLPNKWATCWQVNSGACRRTIDAAISLSESGKLGDHRPARRGRRTRTYSAHGLYWLDILERSAHLLSHWPEESFRCRHNLAVELHNFQARRSPYYRGPPDRS